MKSITTKGAIIKYRDDGIIHVHYDDTLFTLEEIKNIFYTTREHSPWEIAPIYLSGGTFTNQDAEARAFSGSEEVMKHSSAIAFLSKTTEASLYAFMAS